MEFNCDTLKTLPGKITVLEFRDSNDKLSVYDLEASGSDDTGKDWIINLNPKLYLNADDRTKRENLENIINQIGYASARAQDLQSPITTFVKLLNSRLQKVYVIRDTEQPYSIIGILKIGRKRLFLCDNVGGHYEIDATCILDFYIHESKQRRGFGHYLFNVMLNDEKIYPSKLAVDRPSHKFLAFLGKHYGLKDPIAQANNYVVYLDIFNDSKKIPDLNSEQMNSFGSKATPVSINIKSFPYSAENSPQQNYRPGGLDDYFRKKRPQNTHSYDRGNTCSSQSNSWGVYDAMHSYSVNDDNSNKPSNSSLPPCSLQKDYRPGGLVDYFWKKRPPHTRPDNGGNTYLPQSSCGGVYESMHSYSVNDGDSDKPSNSNASYPSSLTPVDNAIMYSQQKMKQFGSSWNVLGVKPPDYSINQRRSER